MTGSTCRAHKITDLSNPRGLYTQICVWISYDVATRRRETEAFVRFRRTTSSPRSYEVCRLQNTRTTRKLRPHNNSRVFERRDPSAVSERRCINYCRRSRNGGGGFSIPEENRTQMFDVDGRHGGFTDDVRARLPVFRDVRCCAKSTKTLCPSKNKRNGTLLKLSIKSQKWFTISFCVFASVDGQSLSLSRLWGVVQP